MGEAGLGDAELVQRVMAGDGGAFGTLVARYGDGLAAVAYVHTRDAEESRDIAQQALFTAYQRLDSLREPDAFGPWLRGIAANLARRTVERRATRERLIDRMPGAGAAEDPRHAAERSERRRRVWQALDGLDEAHREVVALHYLQGEGVARVAELLGRPPGSVKRMLAEARAALKKGLIEMAREEFDDYRLTDEQRRRLEATPAFPREAPSIRVEPTEEPAPSVRILAPCGNFAALQAGAEARYADYDYPDGRLKSVTHVRVEEAPGLPGALRYDDLSFDGDGRPEWIWRPCYRVDGDEALFCAKEYGTPSELGPLRLPGEPGWDEQAPEPECLLLTPGRVREPDGERNGASVDAVLWRVRIGRRSHLALRRVCGGGREAMPWSEQSETTEATEEFIVRDGRLLLWRRYNGTRWSERNPSRAGKTNGTYERLAEAGTPLLEAFGCRYHLWYVQVPEYGV